MSLPDWLDKEAWDGFVEMRKSMKKNPFTKRAGEMALKKLEMYYNQGLEPNAILDQSVFMGWKGLFPVMDQTNGKGTRPTKHDIADEALFTKYPELRPQ